MLVPFGCLQGCLQVRFEERLFLSVFGDLEFVHRHRALGYVAHAHIASLRYAGEHAGAENRIFETRNRNDFLALTTEFYRRGESHGGVLIATAGLPNNRPERLAYALKRWKEERSDHLDTRSHYAGFLSPTRPA